MNGDERIFENQLISKKANKLEEDQQTGKKGKKYKKNKQQHHVVEEEPTGQDKDRPGGSMTKPKTHDQKSDEHIFTSLCQLLSDYKEGTILKALQQTDFDKAKAHSKLLNTLPDNQREEEDWMKETSKQEQEDNSTSSAPSENANMLMNEMFDNLLEEDINGRQFDQLFEEIAEMIKEDQSEHGVPMMDINSFVDECHLIKQTLLVGFKEELSNFDDFEIDYTSHLYFQIQSFMANIIKKQVEQEKQQEEDFPNLAIGRGGKKNILDKIKEENKQRKDQEDFFTPTRSMLPKFAREKINSQSVFNVDNRLASQKDLICLHRDYEDVPIIDLKFIYLSLDGDYNRTVEFLNKHYDLQQNRQKVRQVRTITYSQPFTVSTAKKSIHVHHMREEEIDKEVQHLSVQQIRAEIDHFYKLKQAFKITKMKIKSTNQRKELDRIGNQNQPLIRKLSQASRIKTIQAMAKNNPLYVDLHGWREEEVTELFDAIWRMVNEEANRGNQRVRIKVLRGKRSACLTVMTGKGIHSRGRRSVLKPAVVVWCNQNKMQCQEQQDLVKVFLLIN